ncbi:hypothetical protein [Streptomyces sp. NPDC050504]|uniref:hypothetical protein n=1 Tax=Streptomyces sp. NPDC050504 TaxID=3365618 RepID=UPI00379C319E
MTVIVMLALGIVAGWFLPSAFAVIWAVRLERRKDAFDLAHTQTMSDIRARTLRVEEQMRSFTHKGRT